MRKCTLILFVCLCVYSLCYGESSNISQVQIAPLTDQVVTSEVYTLDNEAYTTCPTVTFAMVGRKEITITNTDSSTTAYIFGQGATESTVGFTLLPKQSITIKVSSGINLFASSSTSVLLSIIEVK